jgi:hypothetical protein
MEHANYTQADIDYLIGLRWSALVDFFPSSVVKTEEWEMWMGLYKAERYWSMVSV